MPFFIFVVFIFCGTLVAALVPECNKTILQNMSTLSTRLESISTKIDCINAAIGRAVSWLVLGMVLVTFLVVIFRYLFNTGWIAMQESITYMHALVFMIGASYTLQREGHVRIDIFYGSMSARKKAWVNLAGTLILLIPMFVFIIWVSWDYVMNSWHNLEGSPEAGGIPAVFLLKTVILVMPALMLLQGVGIITRSLSVLLKKGTD